MKFYTTSSTGDSGLLYLGHWINQYFHFPFRIMSADIGIDAEIEILDEDLHSNGLIIKAQVKSTQSPINANFSEYVEKDHIDYWSKLTVPVIYFKVDLKNNKIYHKIISSLDGIELTSSGNGNKRKIEFDLSKDLLDLSSKQKWLDFFKVVEYHNMYSYIEKLHDEIDSVVVDNVSFFQNEVIEELLEKLDITEIYFKKLEALKNLYPWKFGKEINDKIECLNEERRRKMDYLHREQQMLNYD
ncbi:DUF4365 domain-containing protein [Fulvivirga sediminis]|uniref:DUF4365 domain-containing protein n=1 Tax=Fulvivirga sediminis TaxID=2803949 RepID=A0A937JZG2_9BACT|nr:DUF4365 domain-containing protein [Fulvivirga sediminis]MBL3655166.1 DUF4365 domain-containing protein [Fulvivirga sediminis]